MNNQYVNLFDSLNHIRIQDQKQIYHSQNLHEKSIVLKEKIFENQYQGYKGFLVPGIVALSIMQSGILGVVFTLISYKTQGVLKRLQATPIDPSHFLIGQMISRLLIIVIQTFILFLIGTLILNIDIALGSIYAWINIIIFSIYFYHKWNYFIIKFNF